MGYLECEPLEVYCCAGLVLQDALCGQVDGARLEVDVRVILRLGQPFAHFVLHTTEVNAHAGVLPLFLFAHPLSRPPRDAALAATAANENSAKQNC